MMPSHHTLMRTGKGARTMPFIRFVAVILGLAAVVFGVIVALQGTAVLRTLHERFGDGYAEDLYNPMPL